MFEQWPGCRQDDDVVNPSGGDSDAMTLAIAHRLGDMVILSTPRGKFNRRSIPTLRQRSFPLCLRPTAFGDAGPRLRRGPARVRCREPEGVRYRQSAHDAAGRAGQGAAGSLRGASRRNGTRTVARTVACVRDRRSGSFPGQNPINSA